MYAVLYDSITLGMRNNGNCCMELTGWDVYYRFCFFIRRQM
jgi:hypothetical protein